MPRDRVNISLGRKISDGDYGSYEVMVSYSTDVGAGESAKGAFDRAAKLTAKVLRTREYRFNKLLADRDHFDDADDSLNNPSNYPDEDE